MSIDPIRAAALAAVALFCAGYTFYRVRAGDVRHGDVVYTRSDHPAGFWFSVLFPTGAMVLLAVAMAMDIGSNDFRFDQSVTWFLGAILIGFLLIRALQTGYAGGHRTSFERREEPREYLDNRSSLQRGRRLGDLHAHSRAQATAKLSAAIVSPPATRLLMTESQLKFA